MGQRIILETVHGSHLYGLAHAGSDRDTFTVMDEVDPRAPGQLVDKEAGTDDVVISLDTFLKRIERGSHQSVEALFSPVKRVDPEWAAFFRDYRVTSPDAYHAYERTIRKFTFFGDEKRRRHAIRLAMNLRDLRLTGEFNPALDRLGRYVVVEFAVDEASTAAAVRALCGLDVYGSAEKIDYVI